MFLSSSMWRDLGVSFYPMCALIIFMCQHAQDIL